MTDQVKAEQLPAIQGRRKFLMSAAQVAITAPAAVILLNATTVGAQAAPAYVDANTATGGDDGVPGTLGDVCGSGPQPQDLPVNNPIDCTPS